MKKSILIIYLILVLISISIYSLFNPILEFIGLVLAPFTFILIKTLVLIIIGFFISYFIFRLSNPEITKINFYTKKFIFLGFVPLIFLIISLTPIPHILGERIFKNFRVLSLLVNYIFAEYDIWGLWLGFSLGASFKLSKVGKR